MTFTADVKEELSRIPPTCKHCEKATLAALVRTEGTLYLSGPDRYRIEVSTDSASVGRLVLKLLHGLYGLKTELVIRRSVLHKTPNYLINIPSQEKLREALFDMGIINAEGGIRMDLDPTLVSKRCCAAAYMRGVFLGSGFISNPKSDFHFEMTVESEGLAEGMRWLLEDIGIKAKILQRRSSYMVYLKSGASILEFLAFAGAHKSAILFEEERVVKSVRNDVNRAINAELANQEKASKSAMCQIQAIRDVLSENPIETLPDALQEYIRLRVANPDASLAELGRLADPPISKSAINHRMRRIEAMAGMKG